MTDDSDPCALSSEENCVYMGTCKNECDPDYYELFDENY
jgi:hypothetical protein